MTAAKETWNSEEEYYQYWVRKFSIPSKPYTILVEESREEVKKVLDAKQKKDTQNDEKKVSRKLQTLQE